MSGADLSTDRLRLRPLEPEDLDPLHAHWSVPEVGRWLFDERLPPREQVEKELLQSCELFERLGIGIWGVHRVAGRFIGTCGFLPVTEIDEIEILFSLEPGSWGRGYAYEASLAVLREAFEAAGLERVVGRCDVPNLASKRLLERLGMTLEKREPIRGIDCFHFGLGRDEFAAFNRP